MFFVLCVGFLNMTMSTKMAPTVTRYSSVPNNHLGECINSYITLKGYSTFFGNRLILQPPRVKQLSVTVFKPIQPMF